MTLLVILFYPLGQAPNRCAKLPWNIVSECLFIYFDQLMRLNEFVWLHFLPDYWQSPAFPKTPVIPYGRVAVTNQDNGHTEVITVKFEGGTAQSVISRRMAKKLALEKEDLVDQKHSYTQDKHQVR